MGCDCPLGAAQAENSIRCPKSWGSVVIHHFLCLGTWWLGHSPMTVLLHQLNPGWLAGLISRDRWPADVMAPWHSSTNQGFRSHCSDVSMATNHQPISTPIYGNVQSPILYRDFPVHKTHPAFLGYPHFPSWKAPDVTPRGTTRHHAAPRLQLSPPSRRVVSASPQQCLRHQSSLRISGQRVRMVRETLREKKHNNYTLW